MIVCTPLVSRRTFNMIRLYTLQLRKMDTLHPVSLHPLPYFHHNSQVTRGGAGVHVLLLQSKGWGRKITNPSIGGSVMIEALSLLSTVGKSSEHRLATTHSCITLSDTPHLSRHFSRPALNPSSHAVLLF